jgi:hypothetical protein
VTTRFELIDDVLRAARAAIDESGTALFPQTLTKETP